MPPVWTRCVSGRWRGPRPKAERARSLVGRAGRAAWLPELRLRAEKRMGRSESLDVRASAGTPGA